MRYLTKNTNSNRADGALKRYLGLPLFVTLILLMQVSTAQADFPAEVVNTSSITLPDGFTDSDATNNTSIDTNTLNNEADLVTVKTREKEKLEVLFNVNPQVPRFLVGDPLRLGQVLINLAAEVPIFFSRFERLIECVDHDSAVKSASRERFRFYRDHGYPLNTHNIS